MDGMQGRKERMKNKKDGRRRKRKVKDMIR